MRITYNHMQSRCPLDRPVSDEDTYYIKDYPYPSMIHQKMIDSEDFTTQSISPVTSSAHKPDRYRRFKNFCTVIFPISARQRPQCQKPQSIDWAHLNFTCAGACRTLTEPLPNPYRPLPTLTGNRFMPNTHCIDQYA